LNSNLIQKNTIHAFAPASVANVGCGFDIFGFALHFPGDEVVMKAVDGEGIRITNITGDGGSLSKNVAENTAGVSLKAMMDSINADFGVEMEIHKKMPIGSGLGSSAASSVVSIYALNSMLKKPLLLEELLKFAIEGEKIASGNSIHLDNIAACLYGGFILVRGKDPIDIVKIPTPDSFYCTILHPHIEIKTEASRKLLRKQITLEQAITQWGNVAGAIAALFTSDFELLKRSFDDVVVVPDRAELIPKYYQVYDAAMSAGAIGCSISGSGPSVFALSNDQSAAEGIGQAMSEVLNNLDIGNDVYVSGINNQGPKIIE
jgi:homoserine kinase